MNKQLDNQKARSAMWTALGIALELGYLIAIPIIAFGLGGAWLDKKFGTSPLWLLIGVAAAFIITSIGIYRKIKDITSQIDNVR
jgi:F0F1-type ATP synthase assembly protein I